MDKTTIDQLVHCYVEGWKTGDREKILSTLNPECVVIEFYGPTYRGVEMVGRWIASWFAPGNRVTRWDITSLYIVDETCFFEWTFECIYMGDTSGFEGTSIARLQDRKISFLREYAMAAPRYEWKG